MYVQIIIFLYMIISLKSRIYLTGWNERIGGKRVGAGRDLSREWFSRTSFPLIFAHSLSPLVVSVIAPAELFPPSSRRRNRASDFTYISEMRIRYSISGSLWRALFCRSRHFTGPAMKYHRKLDIICFFFFCFFFSLFLFCFKYY